MDELIQPLTTLSIPSDGTLVARAQGVLAQARQVVIEDATGYEIAGFELQEIVRTKDALDADRKALTDPLNRVVKAINDRYRPAQEFVAQAESVVKEAMLAYKREQDRIAAEARRKADQAAAAERQRLADEARKVREAAAAEQRRLDDERRQREAAARAEQERLEREAREAKDAEARANAEIAAEEARLRAAQEAAEAELRKAIAAQNAQAEIAALEQTAQVLSAPMPVVAPPKASGITPRNTVDYKVENFARLVAYIVTGREDAEIQRPELMHLIGPVETAIRNMVKSSKGSMKLPGVAVTVRETLAARRSA